MLLDLSDLLFKIGFFASNFLAGASFLVEVSLVDLNLSKQWKIDCQSVIFVLFIVFQSRYHKRLTLQ
jgi:hypothetical protein